MEFMVDKVKINAPVAFCYQQWRDFSRLPLIFHNVQSVQPVSKNIWQWRLLDIFGDIKKWDLLLAEDIPNHQITLRTLAGPDLDISVSILFETNGPEESEILISLGTVHIDDDSLTKAVSELLNLTTETLSENLQAFKRHIEQTYPASRASAPLSN